MLGTFGTLLRSISSLEWGSCCALLPSLLDLDTTGHLLKSS